MRESSKKIPYIFEDKFLSQITEGFNSRHKTIKRMGKLKLKGESGIEFNYEWLRIFFFHINSILIKMDFIEQGWLDLKIVRDTKKSQKLIFELENLRILDVDIFMFNFERTIEQLMIYEDEKETKNGLMQIWQ